MLSAFCKLHEDGFLLKVQNPAKTQAGSVKCVQVISSLSDSSAHCIYPQWKRSRTREHRVLFPWSWRAFLSQDRVPMKSGLSAPSRVSLKFTTHLPGGPIPVIPSPSRDPPQSQNHLAFTLPGSPATLTTSFLGCNWASLQLLHQYHPHQNGPRGHLNY